MDQPHDIHFRAVTRILNFVQGTRTHGIHYVAQSSLELVGFIDFDWVGDNIDRNQLLDMCLFLNMDQSAGQVRIKSPLHFHLHRQNTEEL